MVFSPGHAVRLDHHVRNTYSAADCDHSSCVETSDVSVALILWICRVKEQWSTGVNVLQRGHFLSAALSPVRRCRGIRPSCCSGRGRRVGGCEPTGISRHRWHRVLPLERLQRLWALVQTTGPLLAGPRGPESVSENHPFTETVNTLTGEQSSCC